MYRISAPPCPAGFPLSEGSSPPAALDWSSPLAPLYGSSPPVPLSVLPPCPPLGPPPLSPSPHTRRGGTTDYPPAIAPITRNGSAPDDTASGSGASGGSCVRSRSHAKNRRNGRRRSVTWSRIVPRPRHR